jgi:hypothetical protein
MPLKRMAQTAAILFQQWWSIKLSYAIVLVLLMLPVVARMLKLREQ